MERHKSDRLVIGTASRLSPEKGLRYLLEAFAQLRQPVGERLRLRIAGDGPDRSRLDALAERLGIADGVEFTGWIEHEALPAFLQSLDVFVLPSTYEGFGVAAAEASAMALPVVASRVYGLPDVVKNGVTGFLVPAKDSVALTHAVARLVEDPDLREELGNAGRRYVAGRYDWRENVAQMDRLYQKVLSRRSARLPVWT
jgi:glycosyltransferase involved in cell wall biosynthesis